ncbi:MAG: UDP-galactopyranose mutase [Clostridiales bacterium]|nr:UDP-galactopyranose mutase [Clostridiales bacterium]
MYDWIIVGAGLFGAVFANEASVKGKKCLVIDKRNHIAGNMYCENIDDIWVHKYGAHIFHTNDKFIWEYVNKFAEFNNYINSPIANYDGELYNLPFNMNTFYRFWKTTDPHKVKKIIEGQREEILEAKNLEEQIISLIGTDIYRVLVKEYTEKQWGRKAVDLPANIIKRLPVRFTFDNNYFNDRYQGIPVGGYNQIIEKMLKRCDVKLNTNYISARDEYRSSAANVLFTGPIDEYFDYCYGYLEYRSLKFKSKVLNTDNYQGVAVMNFTSSAEPFTRIIEHKHFEFGSQPRTVITYEYPNEWKPGADPYYPINDEKNTILYDKYRALAQKEKNIIFGGRLGRYQYLDMDAVIRQALDLANLF